MSPRGLLLVEVLFVTSISPDAFLATLMGSIGRSDRTSRDEWKSCGGTEVLSSECETVR